MRSCIRGDIFQMYSPQNFNVANIFEASWHVFFFLQSSLWSPSSLPFFWSLLLFETYCLLSWNYSLTKSKHELKFLKEKKKYKENRWGWLRKISEKLSQAGLIREPEEGSLFPYSPGPWGVTISVFPFLLSSIENIQFHPTESHRA